MSLNYGLVIAGTTDYRAIARRAFPGESNKLGPIPPPRPEGVEGEFWAKYGLSVTIYSEDKGYVEADNGTEQWFWEPENCIYLSFDAVHSKIRLASISATQALARVLASGKEDIAYTLNDDVLLLTRQAGVVRKYHQASWWNNYQELDDLHLHYENPSR